MLRTVKQNNINRRINKCRFISQIIKLGKLFTAARKTEVLTNETCQKLLVAHQIVLRGLQVIEIRILNYLNKS